MCIDGGTFTTFAKRPVNGMRQWRVSKNGVLLGTFIRGSRWPTKTKTTRDRISPYVSPDAGLHAWALMGQLSDSYVWGKVICSGKVALFRRAGGMLQGTLSSKQEIVKLWIPRYVKICGYYATPKARRKLATLLRKRYKVPVKVL